jgi:hypothetical protein
LGSKIKNYARCTSKIKSRVALEREAFKRKKTLFSSKLDLNLRKKRVKCCIWSIDLYATKIWTLGKVDQQYQNSFYVVLEKEENKLELIV